MASKKATTKKGSSKSTSTRGAAVGAKLRAGTVAKRTIPRAAAAAEKGSRAKVATKPGNGAGRALKSSAASEASASAAAGIKIGDRAPSFVLQDQTGAMVSSETLRGSSYLIYFYPKDDTPGCTLEACSFRDSMPRFNAKGVRVLGVSPDSPDVHARFTKKYGLPFSLLSDPEKTLAKAYGVWVMKKNYGREYMGVERSTFFVDRSGVVRKTWRSVRVPGHVDEVVHTV
jgi:peroxiredoxin Q/BCP